MAGSADRVASRADDPRTDARSSLRPGSATGVGSLPHRDAAVAADFVLDQYEVPAVPSLPRRSPAEGMIAQAVVGVPGVTLGQYGAIAVDPSRIDPEAADEVDLTGDRFVGLRVFLERAAARHHQGPVKWQFVGPNTLAIALIRAGADVDLAFDVALRSVRAHLRAISAAVTAALPASQQLAVLDEPWMGELMSHDFPVAPDDAIDALSGALAGVPAGVTAGVHCCARTDWPSLLSAGPGVVSAPATRDLVEIAGYLQDFLEHGGWVAWGAVATDGPIGVTARRAWQQLSELWCDMVQRGVDPVLLRRQALVTPHCGLAMHSPATAERVGHMVGDLSRRVRDQATAAKFVLGA